MSFGAVGQERPGALLADGRIVPLETTLAEFGPRPPRIHEILGDTDVFRRIVEQAERTAEPIPLNSVRLGPPILRPGKIVGVGFNYAEHAEGLIADRAPATPVLFLKPWNALAGHRDAIIRPPETEFLDYEIELALVIGAGGHRISPEQAQDHIAGYLIANDITARDIAVGEGFDQPLTMQIAKAKGYPGFCPVGPWMLTADEVDPAVPFELELRVNGELRQRSDTSRMIVDPPSLVSIVSNAMPLDPGDVILTGTPAGCGFQLDPPRPLRAGDLVEASIPGLGALASRVRDEFG
ncbi:fumarylacetoacetate hydrolase family protein [Agromyces bauzanensis]